MDPFSLLPLAGLAVLGSILVLIFASREEPSASRTAWLVGANVVLGVALTSIGALFTFFFFAVMAWGSDSDALMALVVAGPIGVVVIGTVLTVQGVRRARRTTTPGRDRHAPSETTSAR